MQRPGHTEPAAGLEEVVTVVSLQSTLSAAQRARELEYFFMKSRHTVWLIPVMDRDTEVRQLRSGSCHDLEENKAENVPGGLSKLTSPTSVVMMLLAVSPRRGQC